MGSGLGTLTLTLTRTRTLALALPYNPTVRAPIGAICICIYAPACIACICIACIWLACVRRRVGVRVRVRVRVKRGISGCPGLGEGTYLVGLG